MKKLITNCGLIVSMLAAVATVTLTSGCAGDGYNRSTGQTFDDAGTTARVKSKLLSDPGVSGMAVNVDTFRGTVQLTGFVDSPEQKRRAEELTRQTDGVQIVKNDIMVKMNEGAGSEAMKKNHKAAGVEIKTDVDSTPNGAEIEIKADTDPKK